MTSRLVAVLASLSFVAVAAPSGAYDPVLHELILPNERDDIAVATTVEGGLPAVVDTKSGVAHAPDMQRPPSERDHTYAETAASTPSSAYVPDRNTRAPAMVSYDEPFSPSIAPYKRMRAFDSVAADGSLRVRDPALRKLSVGGEVGPKEDAFYADLTVDFGGAGQAGAVAIPSVGPSARAIKVHAIPSVPVEILVDGADNWYARSGARGRVRLVMEVAAPRDTFGGDFSMPGWDELARRAGGSLLPPSYAREASAVAARIGVSRSEPPRRAVDRLVEYFRGFTAGDPETPAPAGRDVYLDLAMSKKGVCRHRAYAFLVTALGLGISSRMVHNEAHAWVEVLAVDGWHRIDLGGAAGDVSASGLDDKPAYVSEKDPFQWPAGASESGQELGQRMQSDAQKKATDRTGSAGGGGNAGGGSSPGRGAGTGRAGNDSQANSEDKDSADVRDPRKASLGDPGSSSAGDPAALAKPGANASSDPAALEAASVDDRPPSRVVLVGAESAVVRGNRLRVHGSIRVSTMACARVRVDLDAVDRKSGASFPLGVTTTHDDGGYTAEPVVPATLAVGAYDVVASTPGDTICGPGKSVGR